MAENQSNTIVGYRVPEGNVSLRHVRMAYFAGVSRCTSVHMHFQEISSRGAFDSLFIVVVNR